jgi:membrane-associated protease RseP (regulator of RpoE activity)
MTALPLPLLGTRGNYRTVVKKEQAMRREVCWFVVAWAFAFGMHGVDRAVGQELIDPRPVDEGTESAPDLPLPEHSLVVEQQARDNSRAFFGVTFDPEVRNAAVARSVSAKSPADLAGVKAGDTIVSVNGKEVSTYEDVLNTLARLKPGDVLDVEITRRVSVRARAVLEGHPVGVEPTTVYRAEPEVLPAPAEYQSAPPLIRAPENRSPTNVNEPRPRQNFIVPQNRNTNVNRNEDTNRTNNSGDSNRYNRGRGGFFRRR